MTKQKGKSSIRSVLPGLMVLCLTATHALASAEPQQPQPTCNATPPVRLLAGPVAAGYMDVYESRVLAAGGATLLKRRLPLADLADIPTATTEVVQGEVLWDAAALLSGSARPSSQTAAPERRLFTAYQEGYAWTTLALKWTALTPLQQAQFNRSPTHAGDDQLGPLRLDYLRGDRSHEQDRGHSLFRRRHTLLEAASPGPPLYLGAPKLALADAAYQDFAVQQQARPAMVYLSANHGMVHGFEAATGKEQFAYLPAALLSQASTLIHPESRGQPGPGVELGVSPARVRGHWKSVLAAGMGAAARGVVVLDVTEPAAFGQSRGVLFEFTDIDDPDMGHVSAAPQIVRMLSHLADGQPVHAYFIVTASGLPGEGSEPGHTPALFLLSLDKAPDAPWVAGVNYHKIRLPGAREEGPNGVVAPALLNNQEGILQRVYLADLQGRLWRLGFENKPLAELRRAPLTPQLLFSATDAQGRPQPVTQRPRIVHAPGGHLLLFGTSALPLTFPPSQSSAATHTFYAIHDNGAPHSLGQRRSELTRLNLTQHPEQDSLRLSSDTARKVGRSGGLAQMTGGWFFDFTATEESLTGDGDGILAEGGHLYFTSRFATAEGCTQGRLFALDLRAGPEKAGARALDARRGTLSVPALARFPADTSDQKKRLTPRANHVLIAPVAGAQESSALHVQAGPAQAPPRTGRRLSWREIINWQELRHAASR